MRGVEEALQVASQIWTVTVVWCWWGRMVSWCVCVCVCVLRSAGEVEGTFELIFFFARKMFLAGLEPVISVSEDQHLIH